MSLIEIQNLHVSVDGTEILKGIDLSIEAGEVHAIMGPNGTEKAHCHTYWSDAMGMRSPKVQFA